jgi:predicted transcriptional regulator of viral defense system
MVSAKLQSSERSDPVAVFRAHGGQLRLSEALALGLNRYQFYKLRDEGLIVPVSRGVYRLADLPPLRDPDLAAVAARFPKAVVCLVSALAWHEMTTQVPRWIDLAVERNARLPRLDYPPVRGYRFAGKRFGSGIQQCDIDGLSLRVYCPEKTLADCFAYRNRLGMDVVLEAMKRYTEREAVHWPWVLDFAKYCRVERQIRPYLQAFST